MGPTKTEDIRNDNSSFFQTQAVYPGEVHDHLDLSKVKVEPLLASCSALPTAYVELSSSDDEENDRMDRASHGGGPAMINKMLFKQNTDREAGAAFQAHVTEGAATLSTSGTAAPMTTFGGFANSCNVGSYDPVERFQGISEGTSESPAQKRRKLDESVAVKGINVKLELDNFEARDVIARLCSADAYIGGIGSPGLNARQTPQPSGRPPTTADSSSVPRASSEAEHQQQTSHHPTSGGPLNNLPIKAEPLQDWPATLVNHNFIRRLASPSQVNSTSSPTSNSVRFSSPKSSDVPHQQHSHPHSSTNTSQPKVPERSIVCSPAVTNIPEYVQGSEAPGSSNSRPSVLRPLNEKASRRQFWHAGDYEVAAKVHKQQRGSMDHVRVHPKFLHSNATSHKWALGAIAELLDNAIDEVVHGATYCNVDMLLNPKDAQPMLVVEDNGGGMSPDKLRSCMSLGYSEKSKKANTIGQYGNGFKTSTMRLGADVIVFSRAALEDQSCPTQSIGLLSFTFLRDTGHEDIVVPMIDYAVDKSGENTRKLLRGSEEDWNSNLATICQWSPFPSEKELLQQFSGMGVHGTRVLVFNMWLTDEGTLELDFETDPYDIQVRGARDEKLAKMAETQKYPNSRHFLTYRHSLRSYASILYLRRPHREGQEPFGIYLRGKEVPQHNLVEDLMYAEEVVYKPKGEDTSGMMASVTIGFVKDAREHIDVQGFCVYHKNRLIRPFWRIWNAAGSQGRGIVGVLEANFVEPAHDKQGFEKTEVLRRLEERLLRMQKSYWKMNAYRVGYTGGGIFIPPDSNSEGEKNCNAAPLDKLSQQNQHATKVGYVPRIPERPSLSPISGAPTVSPSFGAAATPSADRAGVRNDSVEMQLPDGSATSGREHPRMETVQALPLGGRSGTESRAHAHTRRVSDDPAYKPSASPIPRRLQIFSAFNEPASENNQDKIDSPSGKERGSMVAASIKAEWQHDAAVVMPSGGQREQRLHELVDSDWLATLKEENKYLKERCVELENSAASAAREKEAAEARLKQAHERMAGLVHIIQKEREEGQKKLAAEELMRSKLQAATQRLQAMQYELSLANDLLP